MGILLNVLLPLALIVGKVSADTCPPDRPLSTCCMGDIAPYSSNAGVWGPICGYYPANPNELDGGRCLDNPGSFSSCPSLTRAACCKGHGGTNAQCGMAVDCIHPPSPPPIPSGWTLAHSCATDSPTRILQNAVTTLLSDNTPANCIAHCSALTYRFAGVENGNECHCGTGYTSTPTDNPSTQCTAACTGNSAFACGGAWRIQLYEGPIPSESFPPLLSNAWWCAEDSPDRMLYDPEIHLLSNNTPATCAWLCYNTGFTFAGVENGDECHCSTGFGGNGIPPAQAGGCTTPCAGNKALSCGGAWRIMFWSQH